MSLYARQVFQWFTTPAELRDIADRMEASWPSKRVGDSARAETVFGKGLELELIADQERMGRK